MNSKQRALLTLEAIIKSEEDDLEADFLISKVEACLNRVHPEVLLSKEATSIYKKLVKKKLKEGKIASEK